MKKQYFLLVSALVLAGLFLLTDSTRAACSVPAVDPGSAISSQNITTTGTYRVWSRIMAPDTTNNSFSMEIDGGNCYVVGDGSAIPANTWTWVSYQSGNQASNIDVSLSAASHTFKIIGREAGVKVDRVILTGDLACVPSNTKDANGLVGNNCASPPDTTAPSVVINTPSGGQILNGTVSINATASDDTGGSGVSKVEFYAGTALVGTDTSSPYSAAVNTTTLSNGTQTLTAKAYDVAGNSSQDIVSVSVQNATADTQAPSTPTGLSATATAYNSVSVSWTASTDNIGVAGYYVQRDGVTVAQVTTGSLYVDTTVFASTTYSYRVSAFDAAGNVSGYPVAVSVTTPSIPDSQAPTAPTGLNGVFVGTRQIDLSWVASTDNVGVKEYDIYRAMNSDAPIKIATTASLSFGDSVFSNTSYKYYIIARDAAGNSSVPSETLYRTTPQQVTPTSTGIIFGKISEQQTYTPISGATATVDVSGSKYYYVTGINGYYITNGLPAGSYTVKFSMPGYATKSKKTTVSNNTTTILNVLLRKQ